MMTNIWIFDEYSNIDTGVMTGHWSWPNGHRFDVTKTLVTDGHWSPGHDRDHDVPLDLTFYQVDVWLLTNLFSQILCLQ